LRLKAQGGRLSSPTPCALLARGLSGAPLPAAQRSGARTPCTGPWRDAAVARAPAPPTTGLVAGADARGVYRCVRTMQGCLQADREMTLLRDGLRGKAVRQGVVATLEPGVGLLLTKKGDGGAAWKHVVPLPRGRTEVRVLDEPGGARVALAIIVRRAAGTAVEEQWHLRTSSSASASGWVERIKPWLVSWGELVACGRGASLAVLGGREAALHASAAATSISKDALASAGVNLFQLLVGIIKSVGGGVKAWGHALEDKGLIRVGESIPLVGPMLVFLATLCRVVADALAEHKSQEAVLAAVVGQAELCIHALCLCARFSAADSLIMRRLVTHLSALEGEVVKLLRFRYRHWRRSVFARQDQAPSAVQARLDDLRAELLPVLGLAQLELRHHSAPSTAPGQQEPDSGAQPFPAAKLYREAAAEGNVDAKINFAWCLMLGRGVAKDKKRAVKLYTEAAAAGHAGAKSNLGYCFESGLGVAKDERRAFELYTEAAAAGDKVAKYNLGYCFENGFGVAKDAKRAVELYTEAAAAGDAGAKSNLGCCFENGSGVAKNLKRAVKLYTEAAAAGHARAKSNLGCCFQSGSGVAKDEKRAAELYAEAAAAGDKVAQYNLGNCLENGFGVAKDVKRAVELYTEAAAAGDAGAKCKLGYCFQSGLGVAKDEERAVELYSEAAAAGDAVAKSNLGNCFENGFGVAKDQKRAVKLYTEAAAAGDAGAKSNLGCCFENGSGVAKDVKRAVKLYTEAAAAGHAGAKSNLG